MSGLAWLLVAIVVVAVLLAIGDATGKSWS
jgi:hypothetical protein